MDAEGVFTSLKNRAAALVADKGKAVRIIMFLGLAGIALIMLSELMPKGESPGAASQGQTAAELEASLEARLVQTIEKIDGSGRVEVLLTLESGVQEVNADDRSAEYLPRVNGVTVVCDGGGDPVVVERITKAVTTALAITSTHVCVIKMA